MFNLLKIKKFLLDNNKKFITIDIVLNKLNKEELVYQYYQENKDEYIKMKVNDNKTLWICNICGYVYENGELPENYSCPVCGVGVENFTKKIIS